MPKFKAIRCLDFGLNLYCKYIIYNRHSTANYIAGDEHQFLSVVLSLDIPGIHLTFKILEISYLEQQLLILWLGCVSLSCDSSNVLFEYTWLHTMYMRNTENIIYLIGHGKKQNCKKGELREYNTIGFDLVGYLNHIMCFHVFSKFLSYFLALVGEL